MNDNVSINDSEDSGLSCNHGPFDPFPYAMRVFMIVPALTIGVAANVINIMVFRHGRMRTSVVNWYLVVLAFSDLAVLLCSFLMLSVPAIVEEFNSLTLINLGVHLQRWTYAIGLMAQSCSVGMTLLVSGHRFFGVCFPFVAQRLCTTERVKCAIGGMLIFVTVFNLPRWWEIDVETCYSKLYNTTGYLVVESNLRYDQNYYTGYMVCAYTLFMFVIPFVLLIFMNAMIIKTVHQSYLIRQQMTGGSSSVITSHTNTVIIAAPPNADRSATLCTTVNMSNNMNQSAQVDAKENKTTIMLIAVVFMFLICNCLAFINNILEVLINLHNVTSLTDVYLTSVEISNFLVVLNSASNIFIYYAFSVKFRRLTKHYLCIHHKKELGGGQSSSRLNRHQNKSSRRSNYNYNNNPLLQNDNVGLVGNGENQTLSSKTNNNISRNASKKSINLKNNDFTRM